MFYTIKQMAEQLGVTTNKLRYYESAGLIKPYIDPKTGYRYFSVRDTRRFNAVQFYRAFGLSIQECNDLMNNEGHDAMLSTLDSRETAMQHEITYQMHRLQSLLFWKPYISSVMKDLGHARLINFPSVYRIISSYDEVPVKEPKRQSCFSDWLDIFPVCTWASRIKQEVIEGKSPHTHDYGLILPEEVMPHYPHLNREGLVEFIEGGSYVYTVFSKNTDSPFNMDGLPVILSFMEENSLKVGGAAFSNCIYSNLSDGEVINYHYFMVKSMPQ
jgi:Predicted transcriptional regulators